MEIIKTTNSISLSTLCKPFFSKTLCFYLYWYSISDKIQKHIKFKNNTLSFRTNNILGKYIRNNKSKTLNTENSGAYQLKCGSCYNIYYRLN